MKFYVVRNGKKTWIFNDRSETKGYIDGFGGAKYKSFASYEQAENARRLWFEGFAKQNMVKEQNRTPELITTKQIKVPAIAVDASCISNPGNMQYQIADIQSNKNLYTSPIFANWTVNIWEYIAIIHWLKMLSENSFLKNTKIIYSDSKTAMSRVERMTPRSKIVRDDSNRILQEQFGKATVRLQSHRETIVDIQIIKRQTNKRGEIPADFGRK